MKVCSDQNGGKPSVYNHTAVFGSADTSANATGSTVPTDTFANATCCIVPLESRTEGQTTNAVQRKPRPRVKVKGVEFLHNKSVTNKYFADAKGSATHSESGTSGNIVVEDKEGKPQCISVLNTF